MRNQSLFESRKYEHHISILKDLNLRLEEMGLSVPEDDTAMWVYLQSFPDDKILTDKYIYNFGVMDEEMKKHIGDVIDYKAYLQTIIEMPFSEFKNLYQKQAQERETLYLEYPGLVNGIKILNKVGRKKIEKAPEEIERQKEKAKKVSTGVLSTCHKEKT